MSTTTELRLCPFCGGAASVTGISDWKISYPRTGHKVVCNVCAAAGPAADWKDEAISTWNRRSATHGEQSKAGEWTVERIDQLASRFYNDQHQTLDVRGFALALLSSAPAQACSAEQSHTSTPSTDQPNVSKNGAGIDMIERDEFETDLQRRYGSMPLERSSNIYIDVEVDDMWRGWQARAALSARQAPETTAEHVLNRRNEELEKALSSVALVREKRSSMNDIERRAKSLAVAVSKRVAAQKDGGKDADQT